MSFDAMAAALDWLDAYRAGEIEAILGLYAEDAIVECGCGGVKTISGRKALRAYWEQRLTEYPAFELDDFQPATSGAAIAYVSSRGVIAVILQFNPEGRIASLRCGSAFREHA